MGVVGPVVVVVASPVSPLPRQQGPAADQQTALLGIFRCGFAKGVSIRPVTNRIRAFCAPHGWRSTDVRRSPPVVIAVEHTGVSSAGGRGPSSRC